MLASLRSGRAWFRAAAALLVPVVGGSQAAWDLPCGIVEVRTVVDDALIYVDGRFVGMASVNAPLSLRLAPGERRLRASRRSEQDIFTSLLVEQGRRVVVEAGVVPVDEPTRVPHGPFPVGLGQALRLVVEKDGGASAPAEAPVFRLTAAAGERVLLIHTDGVVPTLRATDPRGGALPIRPVPADERDGLDGRTLFEMKLPDSGTADITVSGDGRQKMATTVLWIARAPSPLLKDAKKVGRRAPPAEWRR